MKTVSHLSRKICSFAGNYLYSVHEHGKPKHNPDIANTFFRAGFIESWGRGIEKICTLCKNYGIPEPEYTVHPGDIMLKFLAAKGGQTEVNTAEKSGLESVEKSVEKIIREIRENPQITVRELTILVGLSRRGVEKNIKKTTATRHHPPRRPRQGRTLGNHKGGLRLRE